MEYDTIEVDIGPGNGREYPISVRSLAGEAQAIMRFPFDELALENRLLHLQNALLRSGGQRRHVLSPEQEAVQKFGQDLFNALMIGDVRLCYERSEDRAQREGKGLRIQLRIQPPDMATLPWEFMYDAHRSAYLVLSPRSPVIRYLNLPRSIDPLKVALPLRILGMIANPQGVQLLDIYREKERLERAIEPLQQCGLIELTWVPGETWRDLQRMMRSNQWHIFHFIGHGGFDRLTDEGFIVLANDQQQPHFLPATQLAELLTGYYPPRLVLLNTCDGALGGKQDIFSSTASILIRRGIPAVVAMQYEITDHAAIEFSHSFYEAVANGLSVEAAMTEARKAIWISIPNSFEWGTPVLYTHAPDGILFTIQNQHIERIPPQASSLFSARKPEIPQESAIRPPEQKSLKIETQNKAQLSLPEREVAQKPEKAKEDHTVAKRMQVAQSRSTQPFISVATGQVSTSTVTKRTFFRKWLLTNIVAVAVIVAIVMYTVMVVTVVRPGNVMIVIVIGGGVGVAVGTAQWFRLRHYITQAHWWIIAGAVGGAVGASVGVAEIIAVDSLILRVSIGAGWAVIGTMSGAGAVAAQWFMVRHYIPRRTGGNG